MEKSSFIINKIIKQTGIDGILSIFLPQIPLSLFQSRSYNWRVGTDDGGSTNWYEETIKKVYNKQVRDIVLLWLYVQHQHPSIRQSHTIYIYVPSTSCTQITEVHANLWYFEILEAAVSILAGSLVWPGVVWERQTEEVVWCYIVVVVGTLGTGTGIPPPLPLQEKRH